MTLKNFTGLDASNELLLVETILRLLLAISLGHLKELSKGFIKPLANVLQRTFPVWKGPTALCDRVRALQFCARVPAEWTKFEASLQRAGLTQKEVKWMQSLFLEGRLPLQRLVGENSKPFDERNLPTSKTTAIESNSKTRVLNVDWNMTGQKPSTSVFSPALLSSGHANLDWNSEAPQGEWLQFLAPKQIRINVMFVGKQPKWFTRFIPCPCVRRSLTSPWVNPAIPYLEEAAMLNLLDALEELGANIEVKSEARNVWEKATKFKLQLPAANTRQNLPRYVRLAIEVFEGTLEYLPEFVIVERNTTKNGDINFNIKLPVIRYYPDAEEPIFAEPAEEETGSDDEVDGRDDEALELVDNAEPEIEHEELIDGDDVEWKDFDAESGPFDQEPRIEDETDVESATDVESEANDIEPRSEDETDVESQMGDNYDSEQDESYRDPGPICRAYEVDRRN